MIWRRWTAVREPDRRALLAALLALVILLPAWWLAGQWYEGRLLAQEQAEVALQTSLRGNALSAAINRRLARLRGLRAFIQVQPSEEDFSVQFEKFVAELYDGTKGIRNVVVAPGGTVRYVYPRADNESFVGYEPANDPRAEVRADVQRAIASREVALTGPVELLRGGQGLIARQAVYQGDVYWGLVGMVLDMPTMLEEAGLSGQPGSLDFALRNDQQVFFGLERVFQNSPIVSQIRFPDGAWELAAAPEEGWEVVVEDPLQIFRVAGLIIVGLVASLVYLSTSRQAALARAVRHRTQQIAAVNVRLQQDIAERQQAEAALAEREAQYRSVFESTSDGLLIFDLDGKLVDFNSAAARMHGYLEEEFRRLEPAQFIHATSLSLFERFIESIQTGHKFRGLVEGLRRDGTPFHTEMLGTGFIYGEEPHALAVVRDVTKEVEAYQLLERRVEERTQEISMLLDVSAKIASTLDLSLLLERILEQLQQVVDCDGTSVWILEGDELRNVAHNGPVPDEAPGQMHISREEAGEMWDVLKGNEPLVIGDVQGDTWLARAFRQAFGEHLDQEIGYVRTWVGIPLIVQDRLIGWLSLHHRKPKAYDQDETTLAQAIANQAAIAIENARLYGQARRLAALEERQRLARELHDSVSQVLYGIGLGARTARALLDRATVAPRIQSSLAESLDYVLSLAEAGLAEMRALIFELRPDSLAREGLVPALRRQAAAARARHKLTVRTEFCPEPALPLDAKEALYRITQEALNNIAKHARATSVDLRLCEDGGAIALEIEDDGVGFDPDQEYRGHIGLHSMRERADKLGSTLDIESAPGKRTRIRIRIERKVG